VIWTLAYQQILGYDDVLLETEPEYYTWDEDAQLVKIIDVNAAYLVGVYADLELDDTQIEQFNTRYYGKV
jgi:hypothetical protein